MALAVSIVDDSGMSRKLTIRALPAEWDISLSQASNGQEAMELYQAGKADVMFLDLTMPVMNGFQVLEALHLEDRNCFVIVVSADIQPQAKERAMALGAIAFVRKPVHRDDVAQVLKEFGLL